MPATVLGYRPLEWTRSSAYDLRSGEFSYDRAGFHQSEARFRLLVCGRRGGKTHAGTADMTRAAVQRPGSMNWWVAPIYSQARTGWRKFVQMTPRDMIKDISKVEMYVMLKNGSELMWRSADNEDSLRSEGLDYVACDELAMWRVSAWENALWPSLVDRNGRMVGMTTPKGRNFVFHMFVRGQDAGEEQWASWRFPTHANTSLSVVDIEEATAHMNDMVYRQEILAEFIADAGGVFRFVRDRVDPALAGARREEGHIYFIGVDWGKRRDFSVFTVLDVSATPRRVVDYVRVGQVDYHKQLAGLAQLCGKWRPAKVKAEQTGIGDPLIDMLRRDLPSQWVEGVVTAGGRDGGKKNSMVEKLALAIENGEIAYPDWPELLAELEIYEYQTTASKNIRYGAPAGYHDDCVMSLAIADEEGGYVEPRIIHVGGN